MGKCIVCQGSRLIHHVTEVESGTEDRLSLIISLTPANAYHPDRTIFDSMTKLDINAPADVASYQFFRQKSWHCKEILEDYVTAQPFTEDVNLMAAKLRAVSDELSRVANLIDKTESDKIGFFNEKKENTWMKIADVFLHRLEQAQLEQAKLDQAKLDQEKLDQAKLDHAKQEQAVLEQEEPEQAVRAQAN